MNRADMSERQIATRDAIANACASAKWTSSEENEAFENDRPVHFEANFEKHVNDLRFLVRYRAQDEIVYVSINRRDGMGVFLEVRSKDHLRQVVDAICSRADQTDSTNYKDLLKELVRLCPDIWAAVGDEDDGQLVRLIL